MADWQLLIAHWLVSGLALLITGKLVPGVRTQSYGSALVAAFLIAIANTFVRPILVVLTLPFTIVTLGLFLFVVDAIILRLCAALMDGFKINGWLSAILAAVVLTVISGVLHFVFV